MTIAWGSGSRGVRIIVSHEEVDMENELLEALEEAAGFLESYFGLMSDPSKAEGWSDEGAFETYAKLKAVIAHAYLVQVERDESRRG